MMHKSGKNIIILGAGGLAAGELIRLLSMHPETGEIKAISRSQKGKKLYETHPALRHLNSSSFHDLSILENIEKEDIIFCALPHGTSQKYMEDLMAKDPACIIDIAADYRLKNEDDYTSVYAEHQNFNLAEKFIYGLPELNSTLIKDSKYIANPGCFATAAELLLLPLAKAAMLPDNSSVFAVTGSSGSGIQPKAGTHHPHRSGNMYAYKLLNHQHEPEINQLLSEAAGKSVKTRLIPHSGPFVRGIHASTYFKHESFCNFDSQTLYKDFYANCPFVSVLDTPVKIKEVATSNFVHIHVHQIKEEVVITLALDNLCKGAAGQAIQNMNLYMGYDETCGLTHPGAFPC